jgi:hypothetical protein
MQDARFNGPGFLSGGYRSRTIKAGAYPARPDWMRPPHIHFDVQSRFERSITQSIPDVPLNVTDRCLMSASYPDMLIAKPLPRATYPQHDALNRAQALFVPTPPTVRKPVGIGYHQPPKPKSLRLHNRGDELLCEVGRRFAPAARPVFRP